VPRPKTPLISRRKALEEALKIIDAKGLSALSMRGLAANLQVTGAALYHHFANKEEIVVGAAELALAEVRPPTNSDEDWRTWLPRNSTLVRDAMRAHPELIPVLVRRSEVGMGRQMLESLVDRLLDEGVPLGAIIPLVDALEAFSIGSAIQARRDERVTILTDSTSALAKATRSRLLSTNEIYSVVSRAIVDAIEQAVESKRPSKVNAGIAKGTRAAKKTLDVSIKRR
jgi:TetR/AcrR family tetracycline transcriptional repressor